MAVGALAISLSGCSDIAEQVKQEVPQLVKEEVDRQVDQAKGSAKDSLGSKLTEAKEAVGLPQPVQPDMSHVAYTTSVNPFQENSGHCTWFAWGRAYEKWGVRLPMSGHAGRWYGDKRGAGLVHSSEPRADSVAVWQKGKFGHVAYVERVDGDRVVINEANWVHPSFGTHGSGYTGKPVTITAAKMKTRYGTLAGYIYLPAK